MCAVSLINGLLLLTRFSCSLIESEATVGRNATFFESLAFGKDLGATRGIDFVLKAHNLDAIVLPAPGFTTTPAGAILLNFC
jgi:amidase